MSKITLKKELAKFDAAQLREIILDLYSARKEAKDYLDFFIDPDIEKLNEKTLKSLDKEIGRVKRREVTPRWSKVRTMIKEYASLNPGAEHVAELMVNAIKMALRERMHYYVSATFDSGLLKLVEQTMAYSDKNQVLDRVLPTLLTLMQQMYSHPDREVRHLYTLFDEILSNFKPSFRP